MEKSCAKETYSMTPKMTTWIKFREILIFLLIWPVLPLIITTSGLLNMFYGSFTYVLTILMLVYNFLGWYIAARVYRYRTKPYLKTENISTDYSLKKEIGLFLLIWPIAPILIYCMNFFYAFYLQSSNKFALISVFSTIAVFWFMYGWTIALAIYYHRRKKYFKDHIENNKLKDKVGKFFPLIIFLIVLGVVISYIIRVVSDFITPNYENTSSSGATIRLKISEEECRKYPNRYYFKDLCILCPDEQPLVGGHCQRCPEGELVLSTGCNSCDRDIDYLTPKAECDACPNRIYEGGLCRLSNKTKYKIIPKNKIKGNGLP